MTGAQQVGFAYEANVAETVEWYTPRHIFDALATAFDTDPASPAAGPVPWVPARTFYSVADDGLAQPWEGRVWLNPPYGPGIDRWLSRLADHGSGVALVPVRVESAWGQRALATADVVCFVAGRVRFIQRDGRRSQDPTFGSMLLGYGDCADAVRRCGLGATFERSAT